MIDASEELLVVDVREESEYCNDQHIPGALLYPWYSGVLQDSYSELPPDADLLVVCRMGSRSVPASDFLCAHGFSSIYNMTGGMVEWQWEMVGCIDSDSDGANDDLDNCPMISNPNQEDTYPPQKNRCGDACDCEGDFETDGDVDGSDAIKFKLDFGRKPPGSSCTSSNPCNGDFDCDGNVDGSDAIMFKTDFGRRDCPACVTGEWCSY